MSEGSDIYYMCARYYDASVGRFISEDPAGFVDGANLYLYALGNPISFVDSLGLSAESGYSRYDFLRDASNFSAGVGDSLSFGITRQIRIAIGSNDVVQRSSNFYKAGVISSFAIGSARLAYFGIAKGSSLVLRTAPSVENAMRAVLIRNQLKKAFSLNPFRKNRIYSFESVLNKYSTPLNVINASGRTNTTLNILGGAASLGAVVNSGN